MIDKFLMMWQKCLEILRGKSSYFRRAKYDLQWKVLTIELAVFDALAVATALSFAYELRISSGIIIYSAPYSQSAYLVLIGLSVVLWLGLFAVDGLYKRDNLLGGSVEYQQVLKASTTGVLVLIVMSFLSREVAMVSRAWLLISWGLSIAFVLIERFLVRRVAYLMRRYGWFTAKVLIVGANDQAAAMARQWQHSRTSGMEVVGFVDDFTPRGTVVLDGLAVIGRPTNLDALVQMTGANEVVVVPNAVAWETFEEIVVQNGRPKGYILRVSPGFYELLTSSVAVSNKTFVPLFTINEARIVGIDANMKLLLDYGAGMLLLLLSLPAQLLIAAQLKLTRWDKPVLAKYLAVGQGGKSFTMYKFNLGTAADAGANWFNRWVYSKGLDKLPQLINVLAGHMSLIGPRPTLLGHQHADIRKACNLRTVKPGIIGPWLVGEFWMTAESRDELYYIRNWTIWLDLQILAQAALKWTNIRRTAAAPPQLPAEDQPQLQAGQALEMPDAAGMMPRRFKPREMVETAELDDWHAEDKSRAA